MLNALIAWSARNKFLVVIMTVFITLAGIHAVWKTPLDALPDLSDVQVIIYTEYAGAGPAGDRGSGYLSADHCHADSVPRSKVVRGFSFFGAFRSSMSSSRMAPTSTGLARGCWNSSTLPPGVTVPRGVTPTTRAGCHGRGLGVSIRAASPRTRTLAELRTIQDWFVKLPTRPRRRA
jgi:Cu(I)/Ag(I) efflux system membrane protein CusA/SilA